MKVTVTEKMFMNLSQDADFIDVNKMSDDLKNSLNIAGLDENRLKEIAGPDGKIAGNEFKQLFRVVDSFDSNHSGSSFEYYDKSATPDSPTLSKSGVLYEAMSMEVQKNRMLAGYSSPGPTGKQKPLSEGSKGPEVRDAQRQLNQWRQDHGKKPINENGQFGHEMKDALREFQEASGLKPDAIFGNNVRERLALTTDENFKHVKGSTKEVIYEKFKEYENDQKSRDNLRQLATDPSFARLSKDGQDKALQRLAKGPQSASDLNMNRDEAKDRATLEHSSHFKRLDPSIRKQVLDSFDSYALNPASRKSFVEFATDGRLAKLPLKDQSEALTTMHSLAKPWDSGNVDNLQNMKNFHRIALSSSFRDMDDPVKNRVLAGAKNGANPKLVADLATLLTDDRYTLMSKSDQVKTLNVFESTTPAGRKALLTLLEKRVDASPELETRGLRTTGTLIDQLDRLASSSIDPRVADSAGTPANKAKVMESLLEELANPYASINQDFKGNCTTTSMSYNLATVKPAEYARIVTDLATTGQSKVANGHTIQPPADGFSYDRTNRSVGERLIQSSLMNYGLDGKYSNIKDQNGLEVDQQIKVLNALTGKEHIQVIDRNHLLTTARSYLDGGRGPVYLRLNWDGGGHAVELLKVDGDRVYFRNPWGGHIPGESDGVGIPDVHGRAPNDGGPNRRIEDGPNGIESISMADFLITARSIVVEELPE